MTLHLDEHGVPSHTICSRVKVDIPSSGSIRFLSVEQLAEGTDGEVESTPVSGMTPGECERVAECGRLRGGVSVECDNHACTHAATVIDLPLSRENGEKMYYRTIPLVVLAQVPVLAAQVTDEPVDIKVTSFPGDAGETIFAVDVTFNPRAIRRTDRRKSDHVIGEQTSIFLDKDGVEVDQRQHLNRHHMGEITIGRSESAYVVIEEADFERELREAEAANLAALYASEIEGS